MEASAVTDCTNFDLNSRLAFVKVPSLLMNARRGGAGRVSHNSFPESLTFSTLSLKVFVEASCFVVEAISTYIFTEVEVGTYSLLLMDLKRQNYYSLF